MEKGYFERYPWLKHYYSARNRVFGKNEKHFRYKGIPFTITKDDCKFLWLRDKAKLMKRPSIDRIEPHLGYTLQNCRFVELSYNVARGNRPTLLNIPKKLLEKLYFENFLTTFEIARVFGISQTGAYLNMHRHGIAFRSPQSLRSNEQKKVAKKMIGKLRDTERLKNRKGFYDR